MKRRTFMIRAASIVGAVVATNVLAFGQSHGGHDKMHEMNRNDVIVKAGEVEEWVIFNNSHMDHNFHIHGTQFLVIEHDYNEQKSKPEINGFKDTVNLRPYEKVTIRFVQDEKGLRMYHCHIFEHETLGMMGQLMTK